MPLEPFPIGSFEKGLFKRRDPIWSPADSWRELLNARVYRGRLEKRKGYTFFGDLGVPAVSVDATVGGSTNFIIFEIPNLPVLPKQGSYHVHFLTDTGFSWDDDGSGGMVVGDGNIPAVIGTINYTTGACTAVSSSFVSPRPATVTITYQYRRKKPVMAIDQHKVPGGTDYLLAFDTRGVWQYDSAETRFKKLSKGAGAGTPASPWAVTFEDSDAGDQLDPWNCREETLADSTLTSADFHWSEIWGNALVICQGNPSGSGTPDKVYYYDPIALTFAHIWSAWTGGAHQLDSALMVFAYKGRLVFLSTKEAGSNFRQRVRWTKVNASLTTNTFDAADFLDAPTSDETVSAGFIRDVLYVFFEHSTWRLRYTGDPRPGATFAWEQVAATDGSLALQSTIDFSDEVLTISSAGLISTDGLDVNEGAPDIPDQVLDFNPERIFYSFGVVIEELRSVLWTYVDKALETVADALELQYEENIFSRHTLPFLCFGYYVRSTDLLWDQVETNWNDTDFTFDDRTIVGGYPTVLGGDRFGRLWTVFDGDQDDAAAITFRARTNALRPYPEIRSRLVYVDLILEPRNKTVTFRVYRDFEQAAALEATVDVDVGTGTLLEKIRKRVYVGLVAERFSFEIEETSKRGLHLDGIVPWIQPEGHVKPIGKGKYT